MNNSIKLKRRLTQTLTYLYLIGLSIIIIYPLLITIMSAFKAGNVAAFKLDTNIDFNFDNFKGLFTETLYGTWYLNTLISQYTFNFNNFSIMYLFNGGGPGSVGGGAGSTDILISWIYRLTTGTSPQYSMAAAVTLIISIIVISISMIAFKKLHAFDMEDV